MKRNLLHDKSREIYADYGTIWKFVEKGYVDRQTLIKINIHEKCTSYSSKCFSDLR